MEERTIVPPQVTRGLHVPTIAARDRKQPQTFTDDQVAALFTACEADGQGDGERLALAWRNRAMLAELLDTSVRVSELCSMRVEDIDWERRSLRVLDSKTELRVVGFGGQWSARDSRRYIERTRPYLAGLSAVEDVSAEEGPLWLNRDGYPMTIVGVEKLFKRLAQRADVRIACTPHTCRRYYITRALQRGTPAAEVARQCGVSIEVIMAHYYAATVDEYLERVRQGSPLDHLARDLATRRSPHGGRESRRGSDRIPNAQRYRDDDDDEKE
jgi:integrase